MQRGSSTSSCTIVAQGYNSGPLQCYTKCMTPYNKIK